jgi:hypothetical protein
LDSEEIIPFLKSDLQDLEYYNQKFFTSLKNIDKIYFEKTISMFHDLNDLFFLFYEKDTQKQNQNQNTNQTHNQNTNTKQTHTHNSTKKVYFKSPFSSHKKTIRK